MSRSVLPSPRDPNSIFWTCRRKLVWHAVADPAVVRTGAMGRASDVRRALIHGIGGALTTSRPRAVLLLLAAASCLIGARAADAQSLPAPATKTRVVLLGTGTPPADPD